MWALCGPYTSLKAFLPKLIPLAWALITFFSSGNLNPDPVGKTGR